MNKILEIELNKNHIIEKEKLFNLFTSFFDEEFGFDFNDNSVEIQLGTIDYNSFKLHVNKTLANEILNDETKDVLKKIFDSISAVKSYGLKGNKRVYVDYNKEIKVKNRKEKQNNRGQFFYTNGNNFSTINNELPDEFNNKIICGDSLEMLKKLPDNCIDAILTSPPYNFGLDYAATDDDANWEKYFEKLFAIFTQCIRVLKYGGRAIINVQPLFSDYIPTHHIMSDFFIRQKMIWKGEILWEKNNYNCKYTAWGSWKSPSNPYLKYTWEFLEIFCKGDLKKQGIADNIDISADEFKKWVVGKWSIAPEKNMKDLNHPAMFPEELAMRALKLFSFKNDIILDPFNGAGTTTTVAKKLNRRYIGIDISEEYCTTAEKRLVSYLF
ncbi:MAG: site-specific DNA-methyltransferase [Prevotellaceae bacterium]|jgi:DNA modification methylase|nr:site-specific DNA-methyltransferase [Prevotellaceae bacterium]